MTFSVSSQLHYEINARTTFLFALKCIRTAGQNILEETLTATTDVPLTEFSAGEGINRYVRVICPEARQLDVDYQARVSTQYRLDDVAALSETDAGGLDLAVIPYLFPSRYCPSDQFTNEAYRLFGALPPGYRQVEAVEEWIAENIAYQSGSTTALSSAGDVYQSGAGVCRDFAHLGIAFCRALCIPARYTTCYAYQLEPKDFHACFEAYLSGRWYLFDATRRAPLNGIVRIATGRDAADAAVSTIYGPLGGFTLAVDCQADEPAAFDPVTRAGLRGDDHVLCLL